ncbi:MAG TPA: ion channel [Marinagarivorans sp.]
MNLGIDKQTNEFRFIFLLASLFGAILIPPHFGDSTLFNVVWEVGFSAVLIVAMYSVTGPRAFLLPALILLVPTLASTWLDHFGVSGRLAFYIDNLTSIAFLSIIVAALLRYILSAQRVTTNVIYASMCVYLMLGLIWAAIYANINLFYEPAFAVSSGVELVGVAGDEVMGFFTYYSMITLSTLGYGDIVPTHKVAQAWAAVQAMVGQFYIAVVMARLVSLHMR